MKINKKNQITNSNTKVNLGKNDSNASTNALERERKNYSDYLYQNTTEFNLKELNERATLDQKEKFLQDALVSNEEQKLTRIESFDRYDLAASRIAEHYVTLDSTNSALTTKDLSVQTHLLLLPEKFVNPTKINQVISRTLKLMWENVRNGKVVMINENLLFDSLKFKDKIVPICVIYGKLVPLKYIVKFTSLDVEDNYDILNAFMKILENALNARFYVKFDDEIIILRKGKKNDEQNQLFVSRSSLVDNFSKVDKRERSKEVYDEINLEDVVSNKTERIISLEESKKLSPKLIVKNKSLEKTRKQTVTKSLNKKVVNKPTTTKSTAKKPVTTKKTTAKPLAKKVVNKPTTTKSIAKKPVTTKKTTAKPLAKKVVNKPTTTKSTTKKVVAKKPSDTKPLKKTNKKDN